MKLPPKLAPWAKYLEIFPDEISLTIGNYVQKISPFINPINSLNEDTNGEPNGYDGVARRGIYERLLLSELALADEFGDEFIRRAVMGEHLFLNLAKVALAAKRVSIALFDTGAMQIGSPRIVHIALLILLARRAEIAKARFLWGALQERKTLILPDNLEASVKILLDSRRAQDVSRDDLISWQEELKDAPSQSDIWLIGSNKIFKFDETKKFSKISVEEICEPYKREIELQLQSAAGINRKLDLEIPPIEICTRILRKPFEKEKIAEEIRLDETAKISDISFDITGGKLYAKSNNGNILTFSIDNVKRENHKLAAKNLTGKETGDFIGFGKLKKVNAVFKKNDDESILLLYKSSGNFQVLQGVYYFEDEFVFPPNGKLLEIYNIRPKSFPYDEAYVKDFAGNLFMLRSDSQHLSKKKLIKIASDVKAVTKNDNRFFYIGREDNADNFSLVMISEKIEKVPFNQNITSAIAGRGWNQERVFVCKDESETWNFYTTEKGLTHVKSIETKGEIVGVSHIWGTGSGIFELLPDRKTLKLIHNFNSEKQTLFQSDEEIVRITFNPQSPILAYLTVSGKIFAYSYFHQEIIGSYQK